MFTLAGILDSLVSLDLLYNSFPCRFLMEYGDNHKRSMTLKEQGHGDCQNRPIDN